MLCDALFQGFVTIGRSMKLMQNMDVKFTALIPGIINISWWKQLQLTTSKTCH